ncbi:MAG: hypothetical protein LBE81_06110 [Azonexus sp.]|uniref:hypothetical protein n=1 Tax=Azonexus sp. TaxID=1872668 RepID=UPI0028336D57|nr:hypothetical protein [Azonexus sp.]MDR0776197.1 hypothetical protein [Azonexus sp.]
MKIAIDGTSCRLLKDLLALHRDGQFEPYDYNISYRINAADPLLNQLYGEPKFLYINGDQRDQLLRLLAWTAISKREFDELAVARNMLATLQPQGAPLGAEVGDFVVVRQSGVPVEIVHFFGADDEYIVSSASTSFIVCEAYTNPWSADLQFINCSLDDLMWPALMSADEVIRGRFPPRLAA